MSRLHSAGLPPAGLDAHTTASDPHPGYLTAAEGSAAYVERAGVQSAKIDTGESTTSTSFTDLATAGPAVTATIGATGKALLVLSAQLQNGTAGLGADMGFTVSGASTVAATAFSALRQVSAAAGTLIQASRVVLVTGLTAGSNTFTSKYAANGGGTATFLARSITVIPL